LPRDRGGGRPEGRKKGKKGPKSAWVSPKGLPFKTDTGSKKRGGNDRQGGGFVDPKAQRASKGPSKGKKGQKKRGVLVNVSNHKRFKEGRGVRPSGARLGPSCFSKGWRPHGQIKVVTQLGRGKNQVSASWVK